MSCLSKWTAHAITRTHALKWYFFTASKKSLGISCVLISYHDDQLVKQNFVLSNNLVCNHIQD